MDAPIAEPLAMPPAPGRVRSSRVTTSTGEFAVHAGVTDVEVTRVIVAEVAMGADSPILDVPEEPLVPAPPQPLPATPLPPAPPAQHARPQQAPPAEHRPPPQPERDRGSHRRAETRDSEPRRATAQRQPAPPRPTTASPPPVTSPPPVAPPRTVPPGPPPARPPVPPPVPPTPWRPPETRTRPGRHRGFEEQAVPSSAAASAPAPEPSAQPHPVPLGRPGRVPDVEPPDPVPAHRSLGGRHSNAAPDGDGAEAPGRHRNAETHLAVEQASAEDPQGQHSGGAPVADLVARLSGTGKKAGKGGGRRRRED